MGTPEFAVPSLEQILENGYRIPAVITAPDRPSGRGQKIQPSPVKVFARLHHLNVLQPTNLKDPEFLEQLKALDAQLFVVVAFRMLPEAVFTIPPLGTINLHASLLPDYRGAAPINWVLIQGEEKTGLTTFYIEKEIDTGQIILQTEVGITTDMTAGQLHDILMEKGARLLMDTLELIRSGKATGIPQKPADPLKKAPRIHKEDGRINWDSGAKQIHNLVRGLSPTPGAWATCRSRAGKEILIKIFRTRPEITVHDQPAGSVLTDGKMYLKVAVADGFVHLLDLQVAGKKRMAVQDFLRGQSTLEWQCL